MTVGMNMRHNDVTTLSWFTDDDKDDLRNRIDRGARWLDERDPDWWRDIEMRIVGDNYIPSIQGQIQRLLPDDKLEEFGAVVSPELRARLSNIADINDFIEDRWAWKVADRKDAELAKEA